MRYASNSVCTVNHPQTSSCFALQMDASAMGTHGITNIEFTGFRL